MTICSSKRCVRSVTLAALLIAIALPLGAAQAQRHGPPQMQRGPTAAQPQQPSRHGAAARRSVAGLAALRVPHRARAARAVAAPCALWATCGRRPTGRATGGLTPSAAGSTPMTGAGTGSRTTPKRAGAGSRITTAVGRSTTSSAGAGCRARSGARPGCSGAARGQTSNMSGWAPLPPDEIIVEYVDEPRFWIFVRGRDFVAPRLASVILPAARYNVFFRETVVVNRTLLVSDQARFAVNPGISPTFIAAATRQPLRTYDVRPMVLAGTPLIQGATQVRAQDLRSRDFRARAALQPTQNMVRAADRVQPAQPLAARERGRLGDMPPRAAQRGPQTPSTTGQTPTTRQQAQPPQQPQQQQGQRQGPLQQGQPQQQERRQPTAQNPQRPATQGRGGDAQRQQQSASERRAGTPQQRQQPTVQQQRPATEGRRAAEQRQTPSERRAVHRSSPPPSSSGRRPSAAAARGARQHRNAWRHRSSAARRRRGMSR